MSFMDLCSGRQRKCCYILQHEWVNQQGLRFRSYFRIISWTLKFSSWLMQNSIKTWEIFSDSCWSMSMICWFFERRESPCSIVTLAFSFEEDNAHKIGWAWNIVFQYVWWETLWTDPNVIYLRYIWPCFGSSWLWTHSIFWTKKWKRFPIWEIPCLSFWCYFFHFVEYCPRYFRFLEICHFMALIWYNLRAVRYIFKDPGWVDVVAIDRYRH